MSLLFDQRRSIWEKAVWRMPTLADAERGTGYAGLYTDTPDNHPIIDKGDGRRIREGGHESRSYRGRDGSRLGGGDDGGGMNPGSGAGMTEGEGMDSRLGAPSARVWARE